MTKTEIEMLWALIGQALGTVVLLVVVVIMLKRRAKERREKALREASRSLTPPAAPGPDRPDWRGAPAGRPR